MWIKVTKKSSWVTLISFSQILNHLTKNRWEQWRVSHLAAVISLEFFCRLVWDSLAAMNRWIYGGCALNDIYQHPAWSKQTSLFCSLLVAVACRALQVLCKTWQGKQHRRRRRSQVKWTSPSFRQTNASRSFRRSLPWFTHVVRFLKHRPAPERQKRFFFLSFLFLPHFRRTHRG